MELNEPITERRRQTRSSIYHYLYQHQGFCAKQTLAQELGLSLPTVYQNLTELMEAGLVAFSGEQRSTGGRRAMGLDIVPDARVAVGISVTDTRVRMSLADLRLQELCYCSEVWDSHMDFGEFCDGLAHALEQFLDRNHVDREKLLGVGVAFPAVISEDGKSLVLAPTLHMRNVLLDRLHKAIPYPTQIQNDGTCGGHAESFMRTGGDASNDRGNMAYLSLENGVGGSILLSGKLYDGDHTRSGEFGHMCMEADGLPCQCGRKGCLEAYCSARRISDDLGISLDDFFCELQSGNKEYAALWQDMLLHLARGINNIYMTLDCDVVLGGFLTQYLEPWLPVLRQYVAEANPFAENGDFVHLSLLKSHSVPMGAALYFIQQFVDSI